MHCRRRTDTLHSHLIGDIFFYVASFILLGLLSLYVYWQVQPHEMKYELNTDSFISKPNQRDFLVNVNFCTNDVNTFTISRHYYDVTNKIYYPLPDGIYRLQNGNCIVSNFMGNTGRLDPGLYEYHVTVSYELNPIRIYSQKVAIVKVKVE